MMEREEVDESETHISDEEESRESDNPWQLKSVPEEKSEKWRIEKERYDEVIEYIREVDEILNLIKPFPRETQMDVPVRSDSQTPRFGLDHLENIIKLVEQLKELQEYKSGERTCYLKDLKKLREHKKRLKNEEAEMRSRVRVRSITTPDEYDMSLANRKSSSTSEKLEDEPRESWQEKRKSICLGENRSKVSKWTKVKEAFHWEKTSAVPKSLKRENSTGESLSKEEGVRSREVGGSPDGSAGDVFFSPPTPPPPPPPTPPPRPDLLSVQPAQDFPSSSSSDRLDEFLSFSEVKDSKASPDSPSHPFVTEDIEEVEIATRKSSCEEFAQHLTKEEFSTSRSAKPNKTTWGKVKDIIQTRKDSLKKKPKKRGSDEFKKRRKLSTASNPQLSDQFEDLSSPEDKVKSLEIIPKSSYDFSDEPSQSVEKKRLTPALTVTLPSTEELNNFSFDEVDKRDPAEEVLSQFSCQAQYCEDKSKFGKSKTGSNQRLSRWIKVKRVFLTSATPTRSPPYLQVSNSSPTSQNKSSGFFSDLESDDLSSGEWINDKAQLQERPKPGNPDPQPTAMTIIQEDIRKSYNELQKKLSQEFDQKLREWEMKCEAPPKPEDSFAKVKADDGDCIPKFRKTRDSIAVPLPNLNDLSPEFKKKLNDWKKMKTSQSSSSVSSSATKDEIQGQNIKIRIGEWQPWRHRCSGKGGKTDQGLSEGYSKKFEEESKAWGGSRPPTNRRRDEEGSVTGFTNRRGSKARDSLKKMSHNRTSSGMESIISSSSAEKDGRFIRRSQKVKNFHWVEKELQKIEREKIRLEQEKEKYLEREARLEKMKRTMGTSPTQEILVRTPEGFIRFKGISQKFTKKLYEWEKAKNIAPEASTFALLEESAKTGVSGDSDADGVTMQRSKSTGSVPELSSTLIIQTMPHHPSSLSLNDVDELKLEEEDSISLEIKDRSEGPEAIIVDVEDVEEETAVLAENPPFQHETPVYTYTSEGIEQLTESRDRYFLSGGFGIQITEDLSTDINTRTRFRESKLRVESSREEVEESFLKRQENEVMMVESAMKKFQETEEERKACEDAFQSSTPPSRGFTKSKIKGIHDLEPEEADEPSINESEISCQTDFTKWIDQTERHLTSNESRELSFERKSTQGNKTDPQILKRKIKEKINLMQRMSTYPEFDVKKRNEDDKVGGFEKKSKMEVQEGSVSVFVPTTRKIISPVKTTEGATPAVCSYVIDDVKPETKGLASPISEKKMDGLAPKRDIGIPPLPNSPKTYKKLSPKETAPSIRMIIAKYNQKISEHDGSEGGKRTESVSPIWRSPVFGRRTQEKIERFCGSGRGSGEVQKSVSLDNMQGRTGNGSGLTPPQDHESQIKGILKSSSVGVMRIRPPDAPLLPNTVQEFSPSALRALKIQKAKEDFLSGRLSNSSDASTTTVESTLQVPTESQNPEPEQNLTKSVSAETIAGETSESHSDKMEGRPLQKSSSKFDISSIKSKFRKIRMRKEKEPKANAVAVLCRQSLFIEIPKASESSATSKSCPSSPVMDRNKQDNSSQSPKK